MYFEIQEYEFLYYLCRSICVSYDEEIFAAIYKTSKLNLVQFFYVQVPQRLKFSVIRTQQYRQSNILLCLMAACQKDTFFPYAHIFHELIQIGKTTSWFPQQQWLR